MKEETKGKEKEMKQKKLKILIITRMFINLHQIQCSLKVQEIKVIKVLILNNYENKNLLVKVLIRSRSLSIKSSKP